MNIFSLISKRKYFLKKTLFSLLCLFVLLFFLFLWEIAVIHYNIPKRILPKPTDIGIYLMHEFFSVHRIGYESIVSKTLSSFFDAFTGFIISAVLGSMIGIIFGKNYIFHLIFFPIIFLTQLVPLPAFAPVVAAIFGYDITTKIIIIVLFTIFPVIVNVEKAVHNITFDHISLFKTYNASSAHEFLKLILPSIIPNLLLTLKIISTASFVASIVSELSLTTSGGIGKDIFTSFNNQIIPRVWSSLIIVSFISLVYYWAITRFEQYILETYHYGKNEQ